MKSSRRVAQFILGTLLILVAVRIGAAHVSGNIRLSGQSVITAHYTSNAFILTNPGALALSSGGGGEFELLDQNGNQIVASSFGHISIRSGPFSPRSLTCTGLGLTRVDWYTGTTPEKEDFAFSVEDLRNELSLLNKVKGREGKLASFISDKMSANARSLLERWKFPEPPSYDLTAGLLEALSTIVEEDPIPLSIVDTNWVTPPTKALLAANHNGRQLNRGLLEGNLAGDLNKWENRSTKYAASLPITHIKLSQPTTLYLIKDSNTSESPRVVPSVTEIRFTRGSMINLRCQNLHLNAPVVTLEKSPSDTNAFRADTFNLKLDSAAIRPPKHKISFLAIKPPGSSVPLSMTRDYEGTNDRWNIGREGNGFLINNVRVDDISMVTARPYISGRPMIQVDRPSLAASASKPFPLEIRFREPGVAVHDLKISSDSSDVLTLREIRLNQLATNIHTKSNVARMLPEKDDRTFVLFGFFDREVSVVDAAMIDDLDATFLPSLGLNTNQRTSELKLPLVFTDRAIDLGTMITIKKGTPIGIHPATITIEAGNAGKAEIPIKIEVADGSAWVKKCVTGVLGALGLGYVMWLGLDRVKKKVERVEEGQAACKKFLLKNHLNVKELRAQVNPLVASGRPKWEEVKKVVDLFYRKGLQEGFTSKEHKEFELAVSGKNCQRVLEILKEKILSV